MEYNCGYYFCNFYLYFNAKNSRGNIISISINTENPIGNLAHEYAYIFSTTICLRSFVQFLKYTHNLHMDKTSWNHDSFLVCTSKLQPYPNSQIRTRVTLGKPQKWIFFSGLTTKALTPPPELNNNIFSNIFFSFKKSSFLLVVRP